MYESTQIACDDNHNLYQLELLWKQRMTLPLWSLLPEDVFLKICKHVDGNFEVPEFAHLNNDMTNITYEKTIPYEVKEKPSITYQDLLALRSLPIAANNDTLTPTQIVETQRDDLNVKLEMCRLYREEHKDDFLPKLTNELEYELMKHMTHKRKDYINLFD